MPFSFSKTKSGLLINQNQLMKMIATTKKNSKNLMHLQKAFEQACLPSKRFFLQNLAWVLKNSYPTNPDFYTYFIQQSFQSQKKSLQIACYPILQSMPSEWLSEYISLIPFLIDNLQNHQERIRFQTLPTLLSFIYLPCMEQTLLNILQNLNLRETNLPIKNTYQKAIDQLKCR